MIQNKVDFRRYYGSTSLSGKKRWELHIGLLRNNKHYTPLLQQAFNEFGENCFEFSIIASNLDKPTALKIEKSNCEQTADFCYNMTYVKTGPEHPNWRREWTDDQKLAQGERAKGTKRNDETKAKMRKTAIERRRWISLQESIEEKKTPIKDNLGNVFPSLTEAAEFHGIKVMTACDIVKGRHTFTSNGVSLKLEEDNTPWPVNPRTVYCSNGKSYPNTTAAANSTGDSVERVRYCITPKKTKFADGQYNYWKEKDGKPL